MFSRLKTWLAVAGALVLTIAGALLAGMRHGRKHAQEQEQARDAAATTQAQEVRHDVEVETSKLPDAPAQRVGEADPDSAAGRLRDRWMRDRDAKD